MGWTTGVQFAVGITLEYFLFSTISRPALGPTRPPIQWLPGALIPKDKAARSMKLTTHLHLVPSLRMLGAILLLPQYVLMAWCLVKKRDTFTF